MTETPEIPSFPHQGGELPYLSSPGQWTLAEKSLTNKGPKRINSNFLRSPQQTCSDSNLAWFDLSLATDHRVFISSLSLLTGSLMASPDWSWNIFSPSTIKWYQQSLFSLTPALPQHLSPSWYHLLHSVFPLGSQRSVSSKTPFKSLTHVQMLFPSIHLWRSITPALQPHAVSLTLSLPMFYHFIYSFLPLLPERPRSHLDPVYLLPLIPS